jgi:hypothetical protein
MEPSTENTTTPISLIAFKDEARERLRGARGLLTALAAASRDVCMDDDLEDSFTILARQMSETLDLIDRLPHP